jgi:hypothetical protein
MLSFRRGRGGGGRIRCRVRGGGGEPYQVMTLSAMGEAETPAGGSVCMRCAKSQYVSTYSAHAVYLEVAHEAAAGGSRHVGMQERARLGNGLQDLS